MSSLKRSIDVLIGTKTREQMTEAERKFVDILESADPRTAILSDGWRNGPAEYAYERSEAAEAPAVVTIPIADPAATRAADINAIRAALDFAAEKLKTL